jgi:hypothetical protein
LTAALKRKPKFRSGYEAKAYKGLQARGLDFTYEEEKLPYRVPERKAYYLPDMVITREDGTKLYLEYKGQFSAADRRKMELVIEQHPDKDIRLIFMRNNKLRKDSRTSYTDWCNKRGIKCTVSATGFVPDSWIRGDD